MATNLEMPAWTSNADGIPNEVTATNRTVFADQKILKAIKSRTAIVTFSHCIEKYTQPSATMYMSGMTLSDTKGNEVCNATFEAGGSYRRMLSAISVRSDGQLTDKRVFSYYGGSLSENAVDLFGYPNGFYSRGCPAVDAQTLKFSDSRKFVESTAMSGALRSWTSLTGARTTITYEASKLPGSLLKPWKSLGTDSISESDPPFGSGGGNSGDIVLTEPADTIIGLRIKNITVTDAVSGVTRSRDFKYESPVSSIDLSGLSVYDFISVSGSWYIENHYVNHPLKPYHKYTTFSMLRSCKLPGAQLENVRIYYGKITESVSGTGISEPILTEYEYDTSAAQSHFIAGGYDYNPYNFGAQEVYPGIPPDPATLRPLSNFGSPDTGLGTASARWQISRTHGYYPELLGFEPQLSRKTSYRCVDGEYQPMEQTTYSYRTYGDSAIVTGTFHEALVRMRQFDTGVTAHEYLDISHYNNFQTTLRCRRSELTAEKTTKYFEDGSSRVRQVSYHYTNDVTGPIIVDKFSKGASGFKQLVREYNPFDADSLANKSQLHLLTGFTISEGGHTLGQHTALSANARGQFYASARQRGIHTLPVAQLWQVDQQTALLQHNEYGRFSGHICLTTVSLGLKGQTPIAVQRFADYNLYGKPGQMKLSGQPLKSYSWDGLDQLTGLTAGTLESEFEYQPLVGCTRITYPSGRTESFGYKARRLTARYNHSGQLLEGYEYAFDGDPGEANPYGGNIINTTKYTGDGIGGTTTVYYDCYGNEVVSRARAFGSDGDVVTATERDALDRSLRQWMPMPFDMLNVVSLLPDELAAGAMVAFGDSLAYTAMSYPASAEDYAVTTTLAGKDFAGHPTTVQHTCSNPNDELRRVVKYTYSDGILAANGCYGAGELDAVHTVDADGRETIVFTDCLGRTVLSRAVADGGRYADTYTISNVWGDPLVVIPPNAAANLSAGKTSTAEVLAKYTYVYSYDSQLRLRSKKLPQCQPVHYVYDSEGHMAFSRDGNQSGQGRRSFVLYDCNGRVAVTGTCRNTLSDTIWNGRALVPCADAVRNGLSSGGSLGCGYDAPAQLEAMLRDVQLLTVNYYDDYSFIDHTEQPQGTNLSARGLLTGQLNAVLDGSEEQQLLLTVNYYDHEDRLLRSRSENHIGGVVVINNTYNDYGMLTTAEETVTGQIVTFKTQQHKLSHSYDLWGRETSTVLNYTGKNYLLGRNSFDKFGRCNGTDVIVPDNYNTFHVAKVYTMHGWLKEISSPYMMQTLEYASGADNPSYTGRISAKHTYSGSNSRSSYQYAYDKLGRLVHALYKNDKNGRANYSASYTYDLEANIVRYAHYGLIEPMTFGTLDAAVIQYDGSQIVKTFHGRPAPYESSFSIKETNTGYAYDANGNLTADPSRDIESIIYNEINQPQRINFESGSWLEFVYMANGTKLSMTRSSDVIAQPWPNLPVDTVKVNPLQSRSLSSTFYSTNYVGSYETERFNFNRLNLPGGYVSVTDTVYHWYLADYQGNISGVVNTATKELEQYQDYYPYGKPHDTALDGSDNRRKFGGKELITDKGYDAYDFEARPLTLTIPRFTQPDRKAEICYPTSIYAYCGGDPINRIDPTGMWSLWKGICDNSTRIWGGIKTVGGSIEAGVGALVVGTTGWTGVGGMVGAALLVHGCDVAASGINQMISNTEQTTLTSIAPQSAGLSQETAETIDAGISLIAPVGPVSTLSKSEAITQVGKTVEKLGAEASKIYTGPSSHARGSKIHKYISDGINGKQFGDYTVKTEAVYKGTKIESYNAKGSVRIDIGIYDSQSNLVMIKK